jgi:excisionase family DNA binding protein
MLTPAELAAALRISERTVARMVKDGCPSILAGARRRFDLADVTAWCQKRTLPTCQPAKTPMAAGTPRSASAVNDFIAASRRAQLRVMPSGSKPN